MGVKIIYPDSTQKRQNQRGLIAVLIRDRKETDKRLIRFIDSNNIEARGNRKETDKRLKRDRSGNATIDPNPKPNPEPNPEPKEFSPNSDEFRHANLLYDLILQNDPKAKEPNMQKWVCDIDKLHRLDGRSFEEIEATIQWCQKDDFWHTTILSAGKLRKQFQQLILKMKGNGNAANRTGKKTGFGKHGARREGSRKYAHLG